MGRIEGTRREPQPVTHLLNDSSASRQLFSRRVPGGPAGCASLGVCPAPTPPPLPRPPVPPPGPCVLALLRQFLTGLAGLLSRRHVVVLPRLAGGEARLLDVHTAYRVEGTSLAIEVTDRRTGPLRISVRGYAGHFPGAPVWQPWPIAHGGPCTYRLDLAAGTLCRAGATLAQAGKPIVFPTRRFALDFRLEAASGTAVRQTGHYLARDDRPVDAAYFGGDNYVDHEAESAGEHPAVVRLLREHGAGPRLLEVGCATGGLVAALRQSGFDAVGADFSEWAIAEASRRLGATHAWQWNVERDPAPADLVGRGPFDALVLWVTLEHFRAPWAALEALGPLCAPGARLFIKTTNADSLTHQLFGRDWEGFFDWTHLGVREVGVRTLRERLPAMGWRIRSCATELVWDGNADPWHATLRDWHSHDARFRQLLASRDLGDLVTVVAERA